MYVHLEIKHTMEWHMPKYTFRCISALPSSMSEIPLNTVANWDLET